MEYYSGQLTTHLRNGGQGWQNGIPAFYLSAEKRMGAKQAPQGGAGP